MSDTATETDFLPDAPGTFQQEFVGEVGDATAPEEDAPGTIVPKDEAAEAEEPTSAYDPSAYTVPDVVAYVEAHPEQRAAVLAAEQAGKNRATLVEALGG